MKPKVFGIGLSRTGTTSLTMALEVCGYRAIHCPRDIVEIAQFEAATDITVSMRFETLDRLFPGSRFIYTTRDIDSWLDSCEHHFNHPHRQARLAHNLNRPEHAINAAYAEAELAIYGQLAFEREKWRAAFIRFDARVRTHFEDRELLTMNLIKGDGWKELLAFLGLETIPFPRRNER